MKDNSTGGNEQQWKFQEGDTIREIHEGFAPVGVPLRKTEYGIKWRLRKESDSERCYLVEKEEGGTHLYVASAIEHSFEVVDNSSTEN